MEECPYTPRGIPAYRWDATEHSIAELRQICGLEPLVYKDLPCLKCRKVFRTIKSVRLCDACKTHMVCIEDDLVYS